MRETEQLKRCLLGTCLGDSLGLPFENLPPHAVARLNPDPLKQRVFLGRGLLSDDTLHAAFAAQAALQSRDDPDRFARLLASRIRNWFLCVPPGIGLATARSCIKLSMGLSPSRSGSRSAGNGPMMRAAVLGCIFNQDADQRTAFLDRSTAITHTHELASSGARIVGLGAALACRGDLDHWDRDARDIAPDWPFDRPLPPTGPSGFIVHSVNAVMMCIRHRLALEPSIAHAIRMGGDTDSIAAVVGAIVAINDEHCRVSSALTGWFGWPKIDELPAIASGASRNVPWSRVAAAHLAMLSVIPAHLASRSIARISAALSPSATAPTQP